MKKYLLTLALILPLMAQDSTEVKEESKETITEIHKFPSRKSFGKRAWMGLQDAEWRKFEAAHGRAHSKRGEQYSDRGSKGDKLHQRDKRKGMAKKRAIRSFVRIVVVGGVAYYIGYHKGQHNKHQMNRKPYMGDRK